MNQQGPPGIHIGNQSSRTAADMMDPFEYAVLHGFDAFEWFSDRFGGRGFDYSQIDRPQAKRLRDRARAEGIHLSIHPPLAADIMTPAGQTLMKASLDFARTIGAELVVVHMTVDHTPAAFAEALKIVLRDCKPGDIRLAVENVPDASPGSLNRLFEIVANDAACRGRAGMCLDLGHANLFRATRNDYMRYITSLGDHVPIIHAHVHENAGDGDTHLPLFTGPSAADTTGIEQYVEQLIARDFQGLMIQETWPNPPALLCQARDRLKHLLRRAAKR